MTKTRRLSDLYVVGKEVVFDDGAGEPVKVWLQKLNPVEHETAMRRAAGARARVLAGKDQNETEMAEDEAAGFGRAGCIEYLASDAVGKRLQAIEAELAAEEEWSENNYLQGLKDVWDTTMEQALRDDPNDTAAQQVRDELDRFRSELEKRVESERDSFIRDYESKDDEDLQRRVVDRLMGTRADLAWLTEFRKCEVWLSTREPDDHLKRYFESREDLDHLSHSVMSRLMTEYMDLGVEPVEGKDSGATPSSSPQSESPESPATEEPSGPVAVSA